MKNFIEGAVCHSQASRFATSIYPWTFKWEMMGDERENRNEGCLERQSSKMPTTKQKSILFNAVGDEGKVKCNNFKSA